MTRKEAIAIFIEKYRLALIEDQDSKRIRASGESARTLRPEIAESYGKLFGKGYIEFQRRGRAPGGFPPIESIVKWIKDKRLSFDGKIESVAYLIARKIANSGTDIYQGKRPALSFEDKVEELKNEFGDNLLKSAKEVLLKGLKVTS
jgi:hypothetical protein